jgi:hypothetical protein
MKLIKIYKLGCLFFLAAILAGGSCNKRDQYLDVKSSNTEVVPSSVSDYQAILDYANVMNASYPLAGLLGCDNYYLPVTTYNSLTAPQNTAYIWASDIWQGMGSGDWNAAYQTIEYANICLDGLNSLTGDTASSSSYNNVKGSALFFRAFAFYNLATIFCKPYISSSASTDLGIVLRVSSDANVKYPRSTVSETYNQIINDLKASIPLLPATPVNVTRPCVGAANALLAKVYLDMADYSDALTYSSDVIASNGDLLDFNNSTLVNPASGVSFPSVPNQNPEIIFFAESIGYGTLWPYGSGIVDSNLYNSYTPNDLRQAAFYLLNGSQATFIGSYDSYGFYNFSGIASNEVYLIQAECNARLGNTSAAMTGLNLLLSKRFITGTYQQLSAPSADSALTLILHERRKELPFTANIRWQDLRRLNLTSQYETTLTRNENGQVYTLAPNDPKYVYPIPDDEIQLTGIQQNSR